MQCTDAESLADIITPLLISASLRTMHHVTSLKKSGNDGRKKKALNTAGGGKRLGLFIIVWTRSLSKIQYIN